MYLHSMRVLIALILISLYQFSFSLDMGATYCMKGSIRTNNGKVYKGYFLLGSYDLRIEKDDKGWRYHENGKLFRLQSQSGSPVKINKRERHFHEFVKRELRQITKLYAQVRLIESDDVFANTYEWIPVVINPAHEIDKSTVASLNVEEVFFAMQGIGSDANCAPEDLSWVSKPVIAVESLAYAALCDYTAVFFEQRNSLVNDLLSELKNLYLRNAKFAEGEEYTQEDYDSVQLDIKNKVESLRKLHVLILSSCSC
jgi:hypothetical protein